MVDALADDAKLVGDELFAASELPPGVYVFTDFERLSAIELLAAAGIFRQASQAPNLRCLNDPARAKLRFALLRALKEAGLNDFDAYPANGLPRASKFPVFVRATADHGLALTPLLHSQADLDAALEAFALGSCAMTAARLADLYHALISRGTTAVLRARGLVLAISESLNQHAAYFDEGATG